MAEKNKTFCGGEPTWANACVGDNGNPNYWTYAKGFSSAANLLIKAVLSDRGKRLYVDEYIYPVCFNMRHAVELSLKGAISQAQYFAKLWNRSLIFDLGRSHDINLIWDFLSNDVAEMDSRYLPIVRKLGPAIKDLGEVDPTGQTFRYPISTESQKHLTDVSLINFYNLYHQFNLIEKQLDILLDLGRYLIDEYRLKTFTKTLNRQKIWMLAIDLPPIAEWKKESFDDLRRSLKEKYCVSAQELSKSINLIKNHYEFGPEISVYPKLQGLQEGHVISFLDHCVTLNEIIPDNIDLETEIDSFEFMQDIQAWERDREIIENAWLAHEGVLTPEILAGLSALFYFERELDFSESYIDIYNVELKTAISDFNKSKSAIRSSFVHILQKTNAVHNILKSLYFLKKNDFAEEIVQRYGLENKFSWLDDARSYLFFKKRDSYGYLI